MLTEPIQDRRAWNAASIDDRKAWYVCLPERFLAANPKFSLDLAELLREALRDSEHSERSFAERARQQNQTTADESAGASKEIQDERAFIELYDH